MPPTDRCTVDSNGVELDVRLLGDPALPPLIVLHGMQDVPQSLLPVATALAHDFRVVLPALRGHGASGRPGGYSMAAFVFDLHTLMDEFGIVSAAMFGHSLGGQILTRFAALYPERVRALVVAEGLGPPQMPARTEPGSAMRMEAQRLLRSFSLQPRPLPSVEFAAERLHLNNPRLDRNQALELAAQLTERNSAGELVWAFDPTVQSVFAAPEDSARYWPHVRCPTQIVAGALAHEYWKKMFPGDNNWTGAFAPGELERLAGLFEQHELVVIPGAGHMVHYDAPEQLSACARDFLARHLGTKSGQASRGN